MNSETEKMLLRYEFMVNTIGSPMTLINAGHRYEAANDAFCHAVGRKRRDVLGRHVAEIWGQEDYEKEIRPYLDQALLGQPMCYEGWIKFPAWERKYWRITYRLYEGNGVGTQVKLVAVMSHDITEKIILLEQSQHAERVLREAIQVLTEHLYNMRANEWMP